MPYAMNRGVRINYEVEGDGSPLLLLHGTTQSIADWREAGYADALRDHRQLVSLDLRGHGQSEKPHDHAAYDWPLLVEDATCVLDDRGISSADVFGYSAGSFIALGMAMSAPERVHSLIIGGASNKWAGLSEGGRKLLEQGMESFVRVSFEANGPLPADQRQRQLANDPDALIASLSGPRCTPTREQLGSFDKPTFIYAGEDDPRLEDSKEMASQLPRATLVTLPDINHVQGFWRSDLILPYLIPFLVEVSP